MATGVAASWSPSPGVLNLAALRKVVARYVGLPDDDEALEHATDGINDGISKLNSKTWKWTQVFQDITLVLDQYDYNLSSNVKDPSALLKIDTDSEFAGRLEFKRPKTFNVEHSVSSSGTPTIYTAYNIHEFGTISLNRSPNQAFIDNYPTLRFFYYRRVPTLSAASEQPDIPNEAERFLRWYGRAEVASLHAPQKFDEATAMWRDAWRDLRSQEAEDGDWTEYSNRWHIAATTS